MADDDEGRVRGRNEELEERGSSGSTKQDLDSNEPAVGDQDDEGLERATL